MPPEPLILAFDTSAAHCAAALLCGDAVVAERLEPMKKGQAERLFPLLEELLAEAGLSWTDLTALGVGVGPGNFTGIRISVAAARGLALSLGVPAVGVSGLEAQAAGYARPLLSVLAAPRGQAYAARLAPGEALAPRLVAEAELPALADGAEICGAVAAATLEPRPLTPAIAQLALERQGSEASRPAPLYVRAADAAPASDQPPKLLP